LIEKFLVWVVHTDANLSGIARLVKLIPLNGTGERF
jgi:hypothetical protein